MLLSYNQVSPSDVAWLNRLVFDGYEFPNSNQLAKIKALDPRLPDEIGWYWIEDNIPVSQVCYFIYDIKTIHGFQKTGIPQAVGTIPKYRKLGFGKKVMDKIHKTMIEQDCVYSILSTSRRWKAYEWYKKMGYIDISSLGSFYGSVQPLENPNPNWSIREFQSSDEPILSKLFNEINSNNYGFIRRPSNFITLRDLWKDKKINFQILEDNESVVGFFNFTPTSVNEFSEILLKPEYSVLDWIRFFSPGDSMIFPSPHQIHNPSLFSGLQYSQTDGVILIKDLTGELNSDQIYTEAGIKNNKFCAFSLDRY